MYACIKCICRYVDPTGPVEYQNMIIYQVYVCVDVSMCELPASLRNDDRQPTDHQTDIRGQV